MRLSSPTRRGAIRLFAALIAMLGLAGAGPALAQSNPVYTVSGITVDATAESAAAAQQKALAQGRVAALAALYDRLVPREDRHLVPPVTEQAVDRFVLDFEVEDERRSDVRYLAKLRVRFKEQPVRQFLRANEVPYAETRSKPVVVLPLWNDGQGVTLWEGVNPWRGAWSEREGPEGLVPLVLPLGDLGDLLAIDAERAQARDVSSLQAISERYGGEDALTAEAVLEAGTSEDPRAIRVNARQLSLIGERISFALDRGAEETPMEFLGRAVRAVEQRINESWKARNLVIPGDVRELSAVAPFDSHRQWRRVRRGLSTVALIEEVRINRLTRGQARLDLLYYGDPERLALALSQNDLMLVRDQEDGWRVMLAEAQTFGSPKTDPAGTSEAPSAGEAEEPLEGEATGEGDSAE